MLIGSMFFSTVSSGTATPGNLTLTLISGGVRVNWTDNSGGTAQTEIWGQSNGGSYALLYTTNSGEVKKSDYLTPVDVRYYKIRALSGGIYSPFTSIQSVAMLSSELLTGWTNGDGESAFDPFETSGSTITNAGYPIGDMGLCYSNTIGTISVGDKFLITYTPSFNSYASSDLFIGNSTTTTESNVMDGTSSYSAATFTISGVSGSDHRLVITTNMYTDSFSVSAASLKKILT